MLNKSCKSRCCPVGQNTVSTQLVTICRLNNVLGFPMQIVEMQESHFNEVSKWFSDGVNLECSEPSFSYPNLLAIQNSSRIKAFALVNEKILIGYLSLALPSKTRYYLEIHQIYMKPSYRGYGLASTLLSQVVKLGLVSEVREWRAEISADNQSSKKMFEKSGWSCLEEKQDIEVWQM